MKAIDAIYERGVFRIVKPTKIDLDVVTVKILNREEILTEKDMEDILDAMSEREKGKYHKFEDVFK
jgi:predicted DNA-binding antitoxin AbrB/MazE fold protein